MSSSYIDLNFDADSNNRNANDIIKTLVNLAPTALFTSYKLTTSGGKHLEDFSHAHFVSLLYKFLSNARGSDDLSIGFYLDRNRRQRELTSNKNHKGKNQIRIYLEVFCGFAEHQEIDTFGVSYKLTLTRNSDNSVLEKDNAINIGKIKINAIEGITSYYIQYSKTSYLI